MTPALDSVLIADRLRDRIERPTFVRMVVHCEVKASICTACENLVDCSDSDEEIAAAEKSHQCSRTAG